MNRRGIESVTAIERFTETFVNSFPAVTSLWAGVEVLQALVDDLAVPVRNGNCLGSGRDSIP